MRTLLTPDERAAALASLPAWSAEGPALVRTVLVDDPSPLLERVAAVADAMDHHPVVEPVPGGVRFVLWTHVRGGTTELDVALAARIDALLRA